VLISEEVQVQIREWAATPEELRNPKSKSAMMKKLGVVDMRTFNKYLNNGTDDLVDKLASLDEFQIDQFFKKVYDRAMEPKATAKHMELFAKLKGLLIERKESVNIDLTADDYFKARNDAKRELREEGILSEGN